MEELTQEKKTRIINTLGERGANNPCPRCGNSTFTILDGYFNQPLQRDVKGIVIGGRSVPSIAVACTNCGFLSQHAIGILGLLEGGENDEQ